MSLPPEILKKVKLLEISTRKLVNTLFAGSYHSTFKGQGITFSEFREYVPGDDVRAISWPLTARTGTPHIKKFDEEREMVLMLVVDVSGSHEFGSDEYCKGEVVAHLAALLSFSAEKNNDPVGLLLVSDEVEHFVPPKKGVKHIHRLLRDIYYFKPRSQRTNLNTAFEYLRGVLKKQSNVFVFSDFFDEHNFSKSLGILSRKHEVAAIVVSDSFEKNIPPLGLVEFEDAETGQREVFDTSSESFRRECKKRWNMLNHRRNDQLNRAQVDRIEVDADGDFLSPLIRWFKGSRS